MRWVLSIFILLVVLLSFMPTLRRWGIGRLPGDIHFTFLGREIEIPLMSTILLAVVAMVLGRLL